MADSRSAHPATPELVHSSFAQGTARRWSGYGPCDRARALCVACRPMGHGRDDDPRRWNDASGPRRDSRRLGAAGSGDPGRLDDSTPARPPARNRAAARRGQLVRHDAADLRPRARCLANPVERSRDQFLHATDRPSARPRHRPDRPGSEGRFDALGLQ